MMNEFLPGDIVAWDDNSGAVYLFEYEYVEVIGGEAKIKGVPGSIVRNVRKDGKEFTPSRCHGYFAFSQCRKPSLSERLEYEKAISI